MSSSLLILTALLLVLWLLKQMLVSFNQISHSLAVCINELSLLKHMLAYINQCSRSLTGFFNELWLLKQMLASATKSLIRSLVRSLCALMNSGCCQGCSPLSTKSLIRSLVRAFFSSAAHLRSSNDTEPSNSMMMLLASVHLSGLPK